MEREVVWRGFCISTTCQTWPINAVYSTHKRLSAGNGMLPITPDFKPSLRPSS